MLRPFAGALYAAGGLLDVDWTLNVATLVVFSIFAFVLARFAWAPILKMVQEREQGIKDATLSFFDTLIESIKLGE